MKRNFFIIVLFLITSTSILAQQNVDKLAQKFLKVFKNAVLSDDVNKIIYLTRFPFFIYERKYDKEAFIEEIFKSNSKGLWGRKDEIRKTISLRKVTGYSSYDNNPQALASILRQYDLPDDGILFEIIGQSRTRYLFGMIDGKLYFIGLSMAG